MGLRVGDLKAKSLSEQRQKIVKAIQSLSGRYAPYNIFSDWVEMSALAIQNQCALLHNKIWQDREKLYCDIAGKYTDKEMAVFVEMLAWLTEALEEDMSDVLGDIYMAADMGNKNTGQFFTPFHLSELCARMSINLDNLPETGHLSLNEPSSGGGGMIIAACKVLHEAGFDYQHRLDVVAQDLDWKGVYMTYLQLSLIGCRAIVVQGDTLADPYREGYPRNRIMRTPAMMGLLL